MPIENPIRESSWTVNWTLNASAGLTLHLVDFGGHRVLWEASLPYVTIDHQRPELSVEDQGLEPHGPWWMALGARTLVGEVRHSRFRGGFELGADFASGPYRCTQLWRFHADGRMAPWLTLHGPGLHDAHTYHPHWRFDFDLDAGATGGRTAPTEAFEHFHQGSWERAAEEGWFPHTGQASPEGFITLFYAVIDVGKGQLTYVNAGHEVPYVWVGEAEEMLGL
jgi:hypothetical protein